MKYKSTGSLVATFLGTDNLRHPYNSIVYCGSSFPYSIQTVNDSEWSTVYLFFILLPNSSETFKISSISLWYLILTV